MASTVDIAAQESDDLSVLFEDEASELEGIEAATEPEVRTISIAAEQHAQRLDRALADTVPEFSRSYLQQLLALGAVSLNGAPVSKSSQRVKAGDRVCLVLKSLISSLIVFLGTIKLISSPSYFTVSVLIASLYPSTPISLN